jgi:hypothetical protein
MRPLLPLLSLLLPRPSAAAHLPVFSWAHVPVFFHSSVMNISDFSPSDLALIARFPAVTIEKWQGCGSSSSPPTQQQAALTAARALRALNPDVAIISWFDSLRIYANKTLNPDAIDTLFQTCVNNAVTPFLETHPRPYLLHNTTNQPALESYCHFHVYDHTQQVVRDFWRDACLNLTSTGLVDGCGADASQQTGAYIPGLDAATQAAWTQGHVWAVGNATQAVAAQGGLILGKMGYQLGPGGTNGVLQEGCGASNATIQVLQAATAAAKRDGASYVYECHSNGEMDELAAFLVGAGENHFWGFGSWVTTFGNYSSSWLPQFDLALGAPAADGAYDPATAVWTRSFASGTDVTFNAKTNKGKIAWGSTKPARVWDGATATRVE